MALSLLKAHHFAPHALLAFLLQQTRQNVSLAQLGSGVGSHQLLALLAKLANSTLPLIQLAAAGVQTTLLGAQQQIWQPPILHHSVAAMLDSLRVLNPVKLWEKGWTLKQRG